MAEEAAQSLGLMTLDNPTDYDRIVSGKSTLFKMTIVPGSTAYRYDVTIVKNPDDARKKKELTKQNDPGMRSAQRQCCSEIMDSLFGITNGFNVDCKFVYDGKSILFTNKEIKMNQTTTLNSSQLLKKTATFLRDSDVKITITPNERSPKTDYSDLKTALVPDVTQQADRSVRTFLEVLTSQYLINSGNYQNIAAGCLFENNVRDLVEGMQLRVGFKKGVRVAGTAKNPEALMVLDMKRTAFFARKRVSDIYNEFVRDSRDTRGIRTFENFMRGVRVVITYDTSRSFVFGRLTRFGIDHRDYFVQGKSIPQYIEQTKGIRLKYPNISGVHPDQPNGRKIVYPLEVIEVLHGQLVPVEKLSSSASQRLLAENSVSPDVRYAYVMQQAKAIATAEAGNFLNHFGVKISNENSVNINQRNLPRIRVAGRTITPQANGSWFSDAKDAKFIAPANKLKNWIVVYDEGIAENNIKNYVNQLKRIAASAGMALPEPKGFRQVSLHFLEKLFIEVKDSIQFIFYIGDNRNNSHARLKLFEAYYKVLTQHVATKNLTAGPQTVKNVLMKMNTKTFGLCFLPEVDPDIKQFSLDNDDLMIFGIDLVHPQKLDPKSKFDLKKKNPELENKHPTVVGVSANKTGQRWGFAGDFFYQQSRRDSCSPVRLSNAVQQAVETAKKQNRIPKRVIVFRDGLSEGQQQNAVNEELPAIKKGIRAVHPSLDPKITFIIGTKDHNKRVFRFDGKAVSNTGPGDIVDSKIVREDIPEFYQQSHNPLKGVAKMLQVDTLANELEMKKSQMQKLILMLSSMHQVSACTTSLPLPIYLADETAKRGMDIYNELYSMRNPSNRNDQPIPFAMKDIQAVDGIFNFDQLTTVLGYATSRLVGTRFNA